MESIMKNKLIVFLSVIVGSLCGYMYHLPPTPALEYFVTPNGEEVRVSFFEKGPNGEIFRPSNAALELKRKSYKNREIEQFVSDYFTILEEFLVAQSTHDEKAVIDKFFALINSLERVTKKWEPGFGEFYKIPPMSSKRIQYYLIRVLKEEWKTFAHTSPVVKALDKKELKRKLHRLVRYRTASKAYKLFYLFLSRTRLS